jgi:serine/threonine protein phosphatase 1
MIAEMLRRTMIAPFQRRGRRKRPKTPAGYRAYVVGDIHGRLDLLDALIGKIELDISASAPKKNLIVFLGDLIDRGPSSAQVIERLRTYKHSNSEVAFLSGNHEEVFLRVLQGDTDLLGRWLQFGGGECLASYGLDPRSIEALTGPQVLRRTREVVPAEHISFIRSFAHTVSLGDYLFVHAGIKPGVSLEEQDPQDLRWIRSPFLDHKGQHFSFVVHGHTISEEVDVRTNRIGIDTGAYRTGMLSALRLEDETQSIIQVQGSPA